MITAFGQPMTIGAITVGEYDPGRGSVKPSTECNGFI
jgi:hypothetical protein